VDAATAIASVVVGVLALLGLLLVLGLVQETGMAGLRRLFRRTPDEAVELDVADDEDAVSLAHANAAALDVEGAWYTMTPAAIVQEPLFEEAVVALADDDTPVADVVGLSRHPDGWAASMALAALERREDVPADWVDTAIRGLPRPSHCEDMLQLRAIARHASGPVIGRILGRHEGISPEYVVAFVRSRLEAGEIVGAETFEGNVTSSQADDVAAFLDRFGSDMGADVRTAFDEWRTLELFGSIGRIWQRPFDRPPALLAGRRGELVDLIVASLTAAPRRSVLLVGDHGVGKTALVRAALDLIDDVTVFEATASQILAGQVFIGELDARVQRLAEGMRGRSTVWSLPELQEALFAGQHHRSPHGLLDALLPHVESGTITLVAEVTPAGLDVLRAARPRVMSAFDVIRMRTLGQDDSIAVARHALEHDGIDVTTDDGTLTRAYDLAQQFLPGVAPPGGLLRLVGATAADAQQDGRDSFDDADVLATLAAGSGLPLALLDASAPLLLEDVRAFFERRILQQPDAVTCVVERIAMIKAGLTDPTRPLGVFLFLGPTGTGKTEIAKALAEFLFGSPDRLVRLDMSEFQTPASLDRLLSESTHEQRGAALVSAVRRDPFSVVLLDEFEKAAEPVWDVFLQVFDDGRLTDAHGQVVDFRRCVIVLTSNVGSAIATGRGVGFEHVEGGFSETLAERALRTTFRPEFLNRIDRVVMFRPFERASMRSLLDKELAEALARRGLRERPWAVELDESAYAFLIEKGFSPTLGARPLRRAIEQHVLAPVAAAIVEQTVPAGDQFLFVSAPGGARIEVAFVDPDADGAAAAGSDEPPSPLGLAALARSRRGDERSVQYVLAEARRVSEAVDALAPQKAGALSALGEPTFWETDGRFDVLAKAEYLDRLEAATKTANGLAARLERSLHAGGRASTELVGLLAGRLHVLDRALDGLAAGDPYELFVEVRSQETDTSFADRIVAMYEAWATARGMQAELLEAEPGRHELAVSGLGCWRILHREAGLHVLERGATGDGHATDRETVRVIVAPRAAGTAREGAELADAARRALEAAPAANVVVRRYRSEPSPLVRDSVRGYRTGNLEQVLAGEFDLY
jgi:ATP-dependent Clp protease ATP-binding subunit ClpC